MPYWKCLWKGDKWVEKGSLSDTTEFVGESVLRIRRVGLIEEMVSSTLMVRVLDYPALACRGIRGVSSQLGYLR